MFGFLDGLHIFAKVWHIRFRRHGRDSPIFIQIESDAGERKGHPLIALEYEVTTGSGTDFDLHIGLRHDRLDRWHVELETLTTRLIDAHREVAAGNDRIDDEEGVRAVLRENRCRRILKIDYAVRKCPP